MIEPACYRLCDVCYRVSDRFTLHVPALDIARGGVLGLLGPTGAGKSTLLRMLAGVQRPDSGQLRYGEHAADAGPLPIAVQRSITMVFQHPLPLDATVRANVEYGLRLRGVRDPERVDAVLGRLGLAPLAAQSAQTLSGGQRQLVALARALVIRPRVLLLDEPTANLDPARVALVEQVVHEEQQQRDGLTVVWATHNLFQARRVAEEIAFLLDGQCLEVAAAAQFFDEPSDPRAAAFVAGKMIY